MDDAMDVYRVEAQSCRGKIEKEEILQNQALLDLKERVEKLNDVFTDINNHVDDMSKTLYTYTSSGSGFFYMFAACCVDIVVRFYRFMIYTIKYITAVRPFKFGGLLYVFLRSEAGWVTQLVIYTDFRADRKYGLFRS
ncbi:unnamed protein product [Gongylonema pulchrum]|uniref:t-SNARE coiled-coil homology domain-containing protein n=1 Tax=Gongylonema pulchrum TaxID=637853 RepID=A0A183DTL6_9BILA|nr:unnamed protein product [Gongylonema pulchrum]